jgi:hypothetical protein
MQIQKSKLLFRKNQATRGEVTASKAARVLHARCSSTLGIYDKGSERSRMSSSLDPSTSEEKEATPPKVANWLKVAAVAAVSAFAGGIAAAWWHRKTLAKLRESEENPANPDFGISGADPRDEL